MGTSKRGSKKTQLTLIPTSFRMEKWTPLRQRAGAQIEDAEGRRWPKEFKHPLARLPPFTAEVYPCGYLICVTLDLGLDLLSRFP